MRIISAALSLVLLGAVVLAGKALWDGLQPLPQDIAQQANGRAQVAPPPARETTARRQWPALFGEISTPEPQPPQPPQPTAPPSPPPPPIESLGFRLQGVVSAGSANWAIVSHPTGDRILKEGDELTQGITVVEINDEGLWLKRGDDRVLLGFEHKEH